MVKRKMAIRLSSQSINTTREQIETIDNRPMVSTGKYSVPFKLIHFVVETHLGPAGRRQPNSLNRSGPLPRTVVCPRLAEGCHYVSIVSSVVWAIFIDPVR